MTNHPKRILVLILISSLITCTIFCQKTINDSLSDSLNNLLKEDKIFEYVSAIRKLEIDHYNAKEYEEVIALNKFYDPILKLEDLNKYEDLRSKLIYHAFLIKKLIGYQESIKYYLLAHKANSDPVLMDNNAWFIENELGTSYTKLGDFEKAEHFYKLTKKSLLDNLDNSKSQERYFRLLTNLGRLYISKQDTSKAISTYELGLKSAEANKLYKPMISNTIQLIDCYLQVSKLDSAEFYMKDVKSILPKVINYERYLSYKFSVEELDARIAYAKNNNLLAIEHLNHAHQSLEKYLGRKHGREFGKLYYRYAQIYLYAGDLSKAEMQIQRGFNSLIPSYKPSQKMPENWQIDEENTFHELLNLIAKLYEKKFNLNNNMAYLDSALMAIDLAYIAYDKLRKRYSHDNSKLLSVSDNKSLLNLAIKLNYVAFEKTADNRYLSNAFDIADKSKSVLFYDKLKENKIFQSLSQEKKDSLLNIEKQIRDFHRLSNTNEQTKDSLFSTIEELKFSANELIHSNNNLKLATKIKENYIEFICTDEHVYLLFDFITEKGFKRIAKFNELNKHIASFLSQIEKKKTSKLEAESLYNLLFDSLKNIPFRLVIIPDGPLALVPFEALFKDGKYLIEYHEISYAYHNKQANRKQDYSKPINVVCISPQYEKKALALNHTTRSSFDWLPNIELEIQNIHNIFRKQTNIIKDFKKDSLHNYLKNTSVLHFAGHGQAKNNEAFLVLKSTDNENELWHDYEISQTRNNLDLVTLSACETAKGELKKGEGIFSIGRSFQEAGANSCLMSLWKIDDKSTANIISSFYKNIKKGMSKSDALRKAKLHFINTSNPGESTPYYWSSLILAGNTEPIFQENILIKRSPLLLFFLLLICLAYFFLKTKRSP